MKVLAIMGSHRKGRNTDLALDTFLSGMSKEVEVEKIYLLGKDIKICAACGFCEKNYGQCVYQDDMTELYEKFKGADAIVLASPVYFNGVTTLMKIMIDRFQMVFACDFAFKKSYVSDVAGPKKAYLISVGGAPYYENQFIGSELCVNLVFKDFKAMDHGHYKISETDHFPLEERIDDLEDLRQAGASFLKEHILVT